MAQVPSNGVAENLISVFMLFHKHVMRLESFEADTGLSRSHMEVLFLLDDLGAALPMSKIGEALTISKPYVTSLVDKLARAGLVERRPSAVDRRVINIVSTGPGKEFLLEHKKTLSKRIQANLSNLTSEELAELSGLLGRLKQIMPHLNNQ